MNQAIVVDALFPVIAVVIGAMLPLAALAAFVRWRIRRAAVAQPLPRISVAVFEPAEPPIADPARDDHHDDRQAEAEPVQDRGSLDWVQATIGRRPINPRVLSEPPERRCPRCHSLVMEGWSYCRRCGTRLIDS